MLYTTQRRTVPTIWYHRVEQTNDLLHSFSECAQLEKETMQGTMPGARRRGRPRTAWMDDIKTWTGLPVEESVRMREDRDKWRKYVHGVANPRIEDGERTEQNSPADVPGNRRVLGTVSQSARRVNPDYTAATCSESLATERPVPRRTDRPRLRPVAA